MKVQFGFSFYGIIIFFISMIINFFYLIFPPQEKTEDKNPWFLEVPENITRILYLFLLTFLVSEKEIQFNSCFFYLGVAFLILYYLCWIRYFCHGRKKEYFSKSFLFVPLPLAIFPVLYFAFAALWLNNLFAFIDILLFGIFHLIITYRNTIMKASSSQETK